MKRFFAVILVSVLVLSGCIDSYTPIDRGCSVDSDCVYKVTGRTCCGYLYGCVNKSSPDINYPAPDPALCKNVTCELTKPVTPDEPKPSCKCVDGKCQIA